MIVRVLNNLTINSPVTYLTATANAGTSVLNVKDINAFNASWAIQLGATGEAQTEIVLLSSSTPSGTLGTITATTLFDHPADTPVYGIKYDQLVFERSTTGTAGTATPLTGGTVGIQATGTATFFDDTSGAAGYAYKTFFRNSALAVNSTESDWITTSGLAFYSLGKMRQRVKDKLTSSGYISGINIDDSMINDWINEYYEMMTNAAADVNQDFNIGTTQIAFSAGQELGTITNTDFKGGFRRVWFVDPTGTFVATKMDSNDFSPTKTFSTTYPYFYMQGDTVIGRKPSDFIGTLQLEYYNLNPVLVEDTDQLPTSMLGYTKGFIDYAHSQALFKDQKIQEAGVKEQSAMGYIQRFKTDISPRQRTGATYVSIVEDVAQDQELWL